MICGVLGGPSAALSNNIQIQFEVGFNEVRFTSNAVGRHSVSQKLHRIDGSGEKFKLHQQSLNSWIA